MIQSKSVKNQTLQSFLFKINFFYSKTRNFQISVSNALFSGLSNRSALYVSRKRKHIDFLFRSSTLTCNSRRSQRPRIVFARLCTSLVCVPQFELCSYFLSVQASFDVSSSRKCRPRSTSSTSSLPWRGTPVGWLRSPLTRTFPTFFFRAQETNQS